MVYYKPVKTLIIILDLAKVIINVVIWHYGLSESIFSDCDSVFNLKFWFLLCYFFEMKQKLSMAFDHQTDSQIKRQNNTIEVYLLAFVNFGQDDWTRFLLIAEFAFSNIENTSTDYTLFELNYNFHPQTSYEKDVNPYSQSKSVDELVNILRKLMVVCRKYFQYIQKLQSNTTISI